MNPEPDRIAVPTNGKHAHPLPDSAPSDSAEAAVPTSTTPFSPTQLAVGFGILAAVIALVARGLLRRGRPGRRGPFGRR